uniref:Syndecan n=3 Tax=Passeriformes TaxID=9126 RepID=A0A8C3DK45_CORMO
KHAVAARFLLRRGSLSTSPLFYGTSPLLVGPRRCSCFPLWGRTRKGETRAEKEKEEEAGGGKLLEFARGESRRRRAACFHWLGELPICVVILQEFLRGLTGSRGAAAAHSGRREGGGAGSLQPARPAQHRARRSGVRSPAQGARRAGSGAPPALPRAPRALPTPPAPGFSFVPGPRRPPRRLHGNNAGRVAGAHRQLRGLRLRAAGAEEDEDSAVITTSRTLPKLPTTSDASRAETTTVKMQTKVPAQTKSPEEIDKEERPEMDAKKKSDEPGDDTDVFTQKHSENLFQRTEVLAAVIAGGVIGFLFAIFLILLLVYRMRKKDEGSYDLGERKPSCAAYQKAPTKEFYA